ncbi:Synembryn-B [Myotis davidii]|uniref:Synembryn-B n=1 Tax=Myotis davidii TaxID=225400 RepID=L5LIW4_MYODS|nr:Synembryn-B [Myotis davidii]
MPVSITNKFKQLMCPFQPPLTALLTFGPEEELLKPMGLKPDGTITPLEEALSQYSVIEETSSDTD